MSVQNPSLDKLSVQDRLSHLQAKVLVGPLFISPIKIVWSTIEIIGALALAALLAVGAVCVLVQNPGKSVELFTYSSTLLAVSLFAWGSLAFAALNMASLGIAGHYYKENTKYQVIKGNR